MSSLFCPDCGAMHRLVLDGGHHTCDVAAIARYRAIVRRWMVGMVAAHAIALACGAAFWGIGFAYDEAELLCWKAFEQRRGWRDHGLDADVVQLDGDWRGQETDATRR